MNGTSHSLRFRAWLACATALLLTYMPIEAVAACSDGRVKRLSEQGKTVASIAKTCKMDADDIRAILDEGEEDEEEDPKPPPGPDSNQTGLRSGTPLAPCGCWGPAAPGQRVPNYSCRSGFATPRMCQQMSPAGGMAWQGVCV